MGLSFHDESSLVETASALRFASDVPVSKTGFSQDGGLPIGPDDSNLIPSISQKRRDDGFGGSDDIQMETEGFNQDRSLPIGPDDSNRTPSISQERRDDDFGGSDDVQIGIAYNHQRDPMYHPEALVITLC